LRGVFLVICGSCLYLLHRDLINKFVIFGYNKPSLRGVFLVICGSCLYLLHRDLINKFVIFGYNKPSLGDSSA
jgi:uncharacterized MnhB-related membrane protein